MTLYSTESTTQASSTETTVSRTETTQTTQAEEGEINSVLLLNTFVDNKQYVLKNIQNNGGQLVETNIDFVTGTSS